MYFDTSRNRVQGNTIGNTIIMEAGTFLFETRETLPMGDE